MLKAQNLSLMATTSYVPSSEAVTTLVFSYEMSWRVSRMTERWPLRGLALELRVYVNSKGGVPQNSNRISTSEPSWMSVRTTLPRLMRTDGMGWIVLVNSRAARHSDALSLMEVMVNSPGVSAMRRKLVDCDLAFICDPPNVYCTSNGGSPERV